MSRRSCTFLMVLAAASFLLLAAPGTPAYDYNYARVVRLSLVDGDVQVARPQNDTGESTWEHAVVNLPIQQGYTIATSQGRAEIEFESGATARMAEDSVLQFTELALSGGGRITRLTLTQGTAIFYANLRRDDSFVVVTPHLQVVIPEKASFRVDASENDTVVSTLKGEVEVDSRAGTSRLSKGRSLSYRSDDPDRVRIDRTSRSDAFDRWVADRDEVIHTGNSATLQYVNSSYRYGLWDLYSYGNWYSIPGYGFCWRPYGAGFGWYPFWSGRWAFFPGLGWTWISYEPWGWLPYHFGRWMFWPAYGWVWVPGHFQTWQPAVVTWVTIGNRTGWVPLHPKDRPGQIPMNLQQGIAPAVANTPTGTSSIERIRIDRIDNVKVIQGPATSLASIGTPQTSRTTAGAAPARTGGKGRDQQDIVFDPKERRFVNNPMAPERKDEKVGDATVEIIRGSRQRDPSTAAQPTPASPARGSDRSEAQTESVRPMPVPRAPTSLRPPADRSPAPRQSAAPPQPRVQPPPAPPRTERPASRSESAPPRQTPRAEPAPRPQAPMAPPRAQPRTSAAPRGPK